MKQYVSRRYLKEKWEKLRVDMECVIGVYDDGPDNVAEEAARVAYEIKDYMESIGKEVGIEPKKAHWEQVEVTSEVMEEMGCRYDAKVFRCTKGGNKKDLLYARCKSLPAVF